MPNDLEDAVVLHRRAYLETSLLVDAFAAGSGRVRLLAKGAKRGKTPTCLQPFAALRLAWTGRGELPTLTRAEPGPASFHLDGAGLYCGFYLNELLLHLLPPHDPHPEVFGLYLLALQRLESDQDREQVLRDFETGLLEAIGYGLELEREADSGQPIDPGKAYDYAVERGPVATATAGTDTISGATLLGLGRRRLDTPEQRTEAKRLLRRILNHYLNGRRLKSRDLFKQPGPRTSL